MTDSTDQVMKQAEAETLATRGSYVYSTLGTAVCRLGRSGRRPSELRRPDAHPTVRAAGDDQHQHPDPGGWGRRRRSPPGHDSPARAPASGSSGRSPATTVAGSSPGTTARPPATPPSSDSPCSTTRPSSSALTSPASLTTSATRSSPEPAPSPGVATQTRSGTENDQARQWR